MAANGFRAVLLVGGTLAAAAFGAANLAGAQEAPIGAVNFADPEQALTQQTRVETTVRADAPDRLQALSQQTSTQSEEGEQQRRLQLEIASETGPVDVAFSQRASIGADRNGDLDHEGRGSEVRIGRGLVQQREEGRRGSSVYAFVASDDQALTYSPGQRRDSGGSDGGFALQDQVQVGDHSAGVTYERDGMQASLAYVERSTSTQVGRQSFSQEESFAGVTLTMRH